MSLADAFERAVLGDDSDEDLLALDEIPSVDHDVKFDLALLGVLDPIEPAAPSNEFAPDAEFDAAMIGSGAVVVPPPPRVLQTVVIEPPSAPKAKLRSLDFTFGEVWGPVGFVTTITIRPQCRFCVEKMMATDTFSTPGFGTSIVQVTVGRRVQRPRSGGRGSLSTFFAQNALSDGIKLDTAHDWEDIALTVSFIQECTFYGNLFGSAEIED